MVISAALVIVIVLFVAGHAGGVTKVEIVTPTTTSTTSVQEKEQAVANAKTLATGEAYCRANPVTNPYCDGEKGYDGLTSGWPGNKQTWGQP
jgi:hypothetical protein